MYFVIAIVDIHATVATSAVVVVYVSAIAAAVVIKPLAGFISACAFSLKIYSVSSQVVGSRVAKSEKTGASTCVQTVAVRISIYAYASTSTSRFEDIDTEKRWSKTQKFEGGERKRRYEV